VAEFLKNLRRLQMIAMSSPHLDKFTTATSNPLKLSPFSLNWAEAGG